jgi:predicted rRNA methylase YqxC with S4 and FtsJ domains
MIENRNFLKIAPFATLPISKKTLVFSLPVIKTSCKRTNFILNHILPQLETQNTSYHKLTGFREDKRHIEKLAMLQKAQFSKNCDFQS